MTETDETVVNTGYGQLAVPNSLLRLWNRYGWPEEHLLNRMTEAGTVEATAPSGPGRSL
jgi:hypothetical protein